MATKKTDPIEIENTPELAAEPEKKTRARTKVKTDADIPDDAVITDDHSEFDEDIFPLDESETIPAYTEPVISADDELPLSAISDVSKLSEERKRRIVSITGSLEAIPPERMAQIELQDAKASRDDHKYLTGRVDGVRLAAIGDKTFPVAIVKYGSLDIIIPAHQFIADNPPADSKYPLETLQRAYIRQAVGAKVDFYVSRIIPGDDPDTYLIHGNRIEAMRVKRLRRFFGWNHLGTEIGDPFVLNGDYVEARVVAVKPKFIRVEIMGATTVIPASEMDYVRISDLRTKYRTGDQIVVVVTDLHLNYETGEVTLSASRKKTMRNPKEIAFHKYAIGDERLGIVSSISQNGVYVTFDDGAQCLCRHMVYPARARVGLRVRVSIKQKKAENFNMYGKILQVHDL